MRRASTRITTQPIALATLLLVASVALTSQAQSSSVEQPHACAPSVVEIPKPIHPSEDLLRCMKRMREKSETFRSQCRRLADAPQLHVDAQVDVGIASASQRARTRIVRVSAGTIFAWVTVTALGDPAEWIAHEFEHVIEQVDGVRLPDLAARRRGAWLSGADTFETERAIRVGRQVADEMRARTIQSGKTGLDVIGDGNGADCKRGNVRGDRTP